MENQYSTSWSKTKVEILATTVLILVVLCFIL